MENENIKLNLPPFYVGQRVVYLTGLNLPKDSIHSVHGVKQCPCGCWLIDIGKKYESEFSPVQNNVQFRYSRIRCRNHYGSVIENPSLINWFEPTSFAPLEERFISLAEVIKIESPLTCLN